jgi:hypothetical protein
MILLSPTHWAMAVPTGMATTVPPTRATRLPKWLLSKWLVLVLAIGVMNWVSCVSVTTQMHANLLSFSHTCAATRCRVGVRLCVRVSHIRIRLPRSLIIS